MSDLTPVQALQREIDSFRAKKALLKGDPARAGITIHVPVFEAMLELAKAVAMMPIDPEHGADTNQKMCDLIEALQR